MHVCPYFDVSFDPPIPWDVETNPLSTLVSYTFCIVSKNLIATTNQPNGNGQAQEAAGTDAATALTHLGDCINNTMQRRMAQASERLQASLNQCRAPFR